MSEWRAQVLNAVRECDKTFAENLLVFEKQEEPIADIQLSSTQQQMSARLQSRLISVTGKEAFAIVRAAEGQGVEAWRQLGMRFDPQTDARFALLLIALVTYKMGGKQDVQSGIVKWETMLLSLERDHSEKLSSKIRRALLLNILPKALQSRLLEHLDRLTDYAQFREKVVSLVQSQRNPDAMDCSLVDGGFQSVPSEGDEIIEAEGYSQEEEAMGLAALADIVYRRCQKKGRFARNCKMPPPRGQPQQRTRFMSNYSGPPRPQSGGATGDKPTCPTCKKYGRSKEECWKTYPDKIPP